MSKQVIVLRKDLNMRKGKMCAQASHASMACVFAGATFSEDGKSMTIPIFPGTLGWYNHVETFKKIILGCDSEKELLELHDKAKILGINAVLIIDKGLTEFGGIPTVTALGLGPNSEILINEVTSHLQLL